MCLFSCVGGICESRGTPPPFPAMIGHVGRKWYLMLWTLWCQFLLYSTVSMGWSPFLGISTWGLLTELLDCLSISRERGGLAGSRFPSAAVMKCSDQKQLREERGDSILSSPREARAGTGSRNHRGPLLTGLLAGLFPCSCVTSFL